MSLYLGADKSLARPGSKQARKHVRDTRDFNNIETRAVIKIFFPLQGKALKEIYAILTETLSFFLPGRAKDLSAPLYSPIFGKRCFVCVDLRINLAHFIFRALYRCWLRMLV